MVCLLALWTQLLLVSLVTCKVKSFDLYLKKLPCNTVYILLQNSIKHPRSTRDLGPRVLLSLSLSLYFWLIPWSSKAGWVTQGILASFLLPLSYHLFQTTRFRSIKGPQQHWSFHFLKTKGHLLSGYIYSSLASFSFTLLYQNLICTELIRLFHTSEYLHMTFPLRHSQFLYFAKNNTI